MYSSIVSGEINKPYSCVPFGKRPRMYSPNKMLVKYASGDLAIEDRKKRPPGLTSLMQFYTKSFWSEMCSMTSDKQTRSNYWSPRLSIARFS